ncbi:MAG: hypothetical protein ACOCV1_04755 [Bacillota bacterium]
MINEITLKENLSEKIGDKLNSLKIKMFGEYSVLDKKLQIARIIKGDKMFLASFNYSNLMHIHIQYRKDKFSEFEDLTFFNALDFINFVGNKKWILDNMDSNLLNDFYITANNIKKAKEKKENKKYDSYFYKKENNELIFSLKYFKNNISHNDSYYKDFKLEEILKIPTLTERRKSIFKIQHKIKTS